jgi:hypothetical protein
MMSSKTGSPKATGGGGGNKEAPGKPHCSDVEEVSEVDSDDDEEILETAESGRWQKYNVQVSKGCCILVRSIASV